MMLDEHIAALVRDAVASALADLDLGARPEPREVLSRKEAADVLRVTTHQVDRLARAGRIRRHMLGDSPRYLRSELLEDLASGRAAKSETPGG